MKCAFVHRISIQTNWRCFENYRLKPQQNRMDQSAVSMVWAGQLKSCWVVFKCNFTLLLFRENQFYNFDFLYILNETWSNKMSLASWNGRCFVCIFCFCCCFCSKNKILTKYTCAFLEWRRKLPAFSIFFNLNFAHCGNWS